MPAEAYDLYHKAPADEAAFIAGWANVPLAAAAGYIKVRQFRNSTWNLRRQRLAKLGRNRRRAPRMMA